MTPCSIVSSIQQSSWNLFLNILPEERYWILMQKKTNTYILPVGSFSLERFHRVCQLTEAGVWWQLAPRMAEILQMGKKHRFGVTCVRCVWHPERAKTCPISPEVTRNWFNANGTKVKTSFWSWARDCWRDSVFYIKSYDIHVPALVVKKEKSAAKEVGEQTW